MVPPLFTITVLKPVPALGATCPLTSSVPALIYVDGRSTKMMTPQKLSVPAGPHKITLLDPESGKAKPQDVEIVAGKTASIDKRF